jgi:hypothetical protein
VECRTQGEPKNPFCLKRSIWDGDLGALGAGLAICEKLGDFFEANRCKYCRKPVSPSDDAFSGRFSRSLLFSIGDVLSRPFEGLVKHRLVFETIVKGEGAGFGLAGARGLDSGKRAFTETKLSAFKPIRALEFGVGLWLCLVMVAMANRSAILATLTFTDVSRTRRT